MAEVAITAYMIPLTPVTSINYIWIVVLVADNNWPAVVINLKKTWRKWARLTRVLRREGEDTQTSGQIYLAVVQLVMFYGLDMWVITPRIGRVLGGFHHRVAHRLTGSQLLLGRDGVWVNLSLEGAMAKAGMQEVETDVYRHQDVVVKFIVTRPIMDMCLVEERILGPRVFKQWW